MTGYIFDENDDLAPIMDAILNRIKSGGCNNTDDDEAWMGKTGHRDMEEALKLMMPKEREIIKKYFFDNKRMLDISIGVAEHDYRGVPEAGDSRIVFQL